MKDQAETLEPEIVNEGIDTGDLVTFGIGISLLIVAVFIGGAIATGVVTGLAATLGLGVFIWKTKKYAPQYWNWMVDHPIKTDLIISAVFFGTMVAGATLGGLVAGTSAVVLSTAALPIMKYVGKVEGVSELKLGFKFAKQKLGFNQQSSRPLV